MVKSNLDNSHLKLLFLVFLAAQGFFNPFGLISPQLAKAFFYVFSVMALIAAVQKKMSIDFPKRFFIILILGIFVSSVMATSFHDQSFMTSFVAILPFWLGYVYFYVLCKCKPPIEALEKLFCFLTICSLFMYIANLVTFPRLIFGSTQEEYDMSRGFVRIGVPMIEIVVTYFFYSINMWIQTKKKKHAIWILLTVILIFMSLTRQFIGLSAILGFLFVMQKASWLKKTIVVILCLLVVYVVLPQIPMFKTMMELSETQAENNREGEDIRITAWRFYTTEYQTNYITPFLGNGVPSSGKSRWGDQYDRTVYYEYGGNGCFAVDVGWAGFFWSFGGIATLGLLVLILKGIFLHKPSRRQYLTYSLVLIAITSITSAPILFYSQICSLSLILYMAYASKQNGDNYSQLQQL